MSRILSMWRALKRVLRNFMADRTQVVPGAFVGVFTYCLIVLRTIRTDAGFVPSIAVLGGVVMALIGVGLLIHTQPHLVSRARTLKRQLRAEPGRPSAWTR